MANPYYQSNKQSVTASPAECRLPETVLHKWRGLEAKNPKAFNLEVGERCFNLADGGWAAVAPKSIDEVIQLRTPTMGAVNKYLGEENARDLLAAMIMTAAGLLNINLTISENQARASADMLISDNPLMTVADWRLCLKMGVTGRLGEFHMHLDISVLSKWQRDYWEIRLARGEQISREQKNKSESDAPALAAMSPEVKNTVMAAIRARVEKLDRPQKTFVPDDLILDLWRAEWGGASEEWPTFEAYQKYKTKKYNGNQK